MIDNITIALIGVLAGMISMTIIGILAVRNENKKKVPNWGEREKIINS